MDGDTAGTAVAEAIASWRGRGVPEAATAFARNVVAAARPSGPARARTLLWVCSRLGAWALGLGYELEPRVCLHPSAIERYSVWALDHAPPSRRRSVRTNLRWVAARAVPDVPQRPWPQPLPRDRAKAPYTAAEIAGYLALAAAQSTEQRRHHLTALVCLGAGAGLDGADLRYVTGRHVGDRSGGLVVVVEGSRARVVPVLRRFHEPLRAAACFAGDGYICGGSSATRRNITAQLTGRLHGGTDLPRLEVARLRATWLGHHVQRLGLRGFLDAAGVTCTQRLGDLAAHVPALSETDTVALLDAPT